LIDKIVAGQLDGDDWTSVKKEGDSQFYIGKYAYLWTEPLAPSNRAIYRIDYVAVISDNESGQGTLIPSSELSMKIEIYNDMEIWIGGITIGDTPSNNAIAKAFVEELERMIQERS
jgi:hypothetical protein